jgi:hypothetical protein
LSGSAALLGSLKFVGDIDYCEYALPGTYTAADVVASVGAHATRVASPLCERIKVRDTKWWRSADMWNAVAAAELTREIEAGASELKLDFVTKTNAVGAVEATNLALLLRAGAEDTGVRASFAAQEVPMPGAMLPRPLCDALQLGRYINFLVQQVAHYAQVSPVKATKRALSLSRILMMSGWDDRLVDRLQDPSAALNAAIEARSELLETLRGAPHDESPRAEARREVTRALGGTIDDLRKKQASQTLPPDVVAGLWTVETTAILEEFIQEVRTTIAAA